MSKSYKNQKDYDAEYDFVEPVLSVRDLKKAEKLLRDERRASHNIEETDENDNERPTTRPSRS